MDAFEGRENRNLNAFRLLSLAAALFLIGTQFGWLNYNGKGACPQVIYIANNHSDNQEVQYENWFTTQRYLGTINDVEAIRWIENIYA
jgi:kynureninase